jgi:hypothetical protein
MDVRDFVLMGGHYSATCGPGQSTRNRCESGRVAHGSVKAREMEYRGKQYSVVQGLDTMWKWSVPALVGQTKSGKKESHAAGVGAAQRAIDKSLAPKKQRLRRPE